MLKKIDKVIEEQIQLLTEDNNQIIYTNEDQFKLKSGPKIQLGKVSIKDATILVGRYLNCYSMFPNIYIYTCYPGLNHQIYDMAGWNKLIKNPKINTKGKIKIKVIIEGVDWITGRPSCSMTISFPDVSFDIFKEY